jgi:hypothetical protein
MAFIHSLRVSSALLAQHKGQLLDLVLSDRDVQGVGCSKLELVGEVVALAEGLSAVVAGAGLEQSSRGEMKVSSSDEAVVMKLYTDAALPRSPPSTQPHARHVIEQEHRVEVAHRPSHNRATLVLSSGHLRRPIDLALLPPHEQPPPQEGA